jgi:hypothetical protein
MKNKLFVLFVMASVLLIMVAFDYGDAFADAKARAERDSTDARAHAWVSNGPHQSTHEHGGPNSFVQAWAGSNNANGSHAEAVAIASNQGDSLYIFEHESKTIMPGDQGGAKFDSVVNEAEFACSLSAVIEQQAIIRTLGSGRAFPIEAGDDNIFRFAFTLTDDTGETCFWGEIVFGSYQLLTGGDYDTTGIVVTFFESDSVHVTVDRYDTVSFSGPADSLIMEGVLAGRAANVPTVTQWGLIILVALVVVSTIFIMLRKRKAAVPA